MPAYLSHAPTSGLLTSDSVTGEISSSLLNNILPIWWNSHLLCSQSNMTRFSTVSAKGLLVRYICAGSPLCDDWGVCHNLCNPWDQPSPLWGWRGSLYNRGWEKMLSKYSLCSDSKVILLKGSLFFCPFIRRCLNHVCSAVVCCVGAGLGLFRAVRPPAQTLSVPPSAAQCALWSVFYAGSHCCLPLPAHWPTSPAHSISQQSIGQGHREPAVITAGRMCVVLLCIYENDSFPIYP